MRALQNRLIVLGFDGIQPDGIFGAATEDAVERFQASKGILDDGIVGPTTAKLLGLEWPSGGASIAPNGPPLRFVQVAADKVPNYGGFVTLRLREDAAQAWNALREDAHAAGAVVTTAGGVRALTPPGASIGSAQSQTSLHYLGLAFDLAIPTGGNDPQRDPYVLALADGRWTVWAASSNADTPEVEVDAVVIYGGAAAKIKRVRCRRRMINFTALAALHGFRPIRPRRSFLRGTGSTMGAEWWHFQFERPLIEGATFGGELRRVYTAAECQKFAFWDAVAALPWGTGWA